MVMRPTNHMISTYDHPHDLLTWSRHVTYELHPNIKSSSIPASVSWLHPSLLVSHMIIISFHYHGMCHPLSKDLVWASSRGALEARKEDYFKINASPGIWWWWLDWGKVPLIVTTGAWSRRSALNRFKPLGEPRVKW